MLNCLDLCSMQGTTGVLEDQAVGTLGGMRRGAWDVAAGISPEDLHSSLPLLFPATWPRSTITPCVILEPAAMSEPPTQILSKAVTKGAESSHWDLLVRTSRKALASCWQHSQGRIPHMGLNIPSMKGAIWASVIMFTVGRGLDDSFYQQGYS